MDANRFFLDQVQKQVNAAMTIRNWLIGHYIYEYEQKGVDRAEYGDKIYRGLADNLKSKGVKGFSFTNLHLYKQFYITYPEIASTLSKYSDVIDKQFFGISQTLSGKSSDLKQTPPDTLINRLSFSHFIELIKQDQPLKRLFYETMSISNNWSVRELQRAISSMLYERTGLSEDKQAVLESHQKGSGTRPEDFLRNPYVLEFLNVETKAILEESDLEGEIISQLQNFLLEMGKGFCFEERQKRITFDNTHYRIDLVFYHRILKCHVLIDLKMEDFSPADAGQMNMYLNYYRENEMQENDAAPIGIILCAGKSETLAKYATAGLSQKVFVSKYLTSLPSEEQLQQLIRCEQEKAL
ncbi:PDDEXK nuclease domain-containing protein [Pseudoflavitalea rhizosphaerae]|uniref:PDDEXK nuclease domain-containing protein n=1 Tax=Pseudoflavitalea rhizosphaerae TaxID=1884793 RepID=UPI0024085B32|nr:PDDEXK nuclease domain-containing protein [Pseudoflavitalea rhizosphaerae]